MEHQKGEHHGRGGHEHEGKHHGDDGKDGGKREELREDLTDIHHDRKALKEADDPEERRRAQQELNEDQKDLKSDWGKGMPEHAGEAHHGRGGHGGGEGRGGHGGGHGGRND